jgi:hypothetical protein
MKDQVSIPGRGGNFFSYPQRPDLGRIRHPSNGYWGVDNSHPSSAEVKNEWSYTPPPPPSSSRAA